MYACKEKHYRFEGGYILQSRPLYLLYAGHYASYESASWHSPALLHPAVGELPGGGGMSKPIGKWSVM